MVKEQISDEELSVRISVMASLIPLLADRLKENPFSQQAVEDRRFLRVTVLQLRWIAGHGSKDLQASINASLDRLQDAMPEVWES
jgi:hypothetical protein